MCFTFSNLQLIFNFKLRRFSTERALNESEIGERKELIPSCFSPLSLSPSFMLRSLPTHIILLHYFLTVSDVALIVSAKCNFACHLEPLPLFELRVTLLPYSFPPFSLIIIL